MDFESVIFLGSILKCSELDDIVRSLVDRIFKIIEQEDCVVVFDVGYVRVFEIKEVKFFVELGDVVDGV